MQDSSSMSLIECAIELGVTLEIATAEGRCVECGEDYPLATKKEGIVVCSSPRCNQNLWVDIQEADFKKTGSRICSLPGCLKSCSSKGTDYCDQGHEEEHRDVLKGMYSTFGIGMYSLDTRSVAALTLLTSCAARKGSGVLSINDLCLAQLQLCANQIAEVTILGISIMDLMMHVLLVC